MIKSNPDLPSRPNLSSCVGLVESFHSSFEKEVSDPDEFDLSYEFFNSCDTEFVPANSISLVDICFYFEVDIIYHEPSDLGTIESSFIDSSLTSPFVEEKSCMCFCQSDLH